MTSDGLCAALADLIQRTWRNTSTTPDEKQEAPDKAESPSRRVVMSTLNLLCLQEPSRADGHQGERRTQPAGSKLGLKAGAHAVRLHISEGEQLKLI